MPLDAARLATEADAHEERLRGPLWRPEVEGGPEEGDNWTAALRGNQGPSPEAHETEPPWTEPPQAGLPESVVLARLAALDAAVEGLRADVRASRRDEDDPLAAIAEAAGEPRTYDAPDSRRIGTFIRVLPELRRAVAAVKERRGLRSDAGAWEYVVRLGIAAANRV